MKSMLVGFLTIAVISGFGMFACASDGDRPCNYTEFGLDGKKFFMYFTQDTPYTSWQLWPGKGKLNPGKEPHGSFLTTYVNPAAYGSITGKKGMAFGSLIVVENYGPDQKLADISAKIKIKGYHPQADDWYWFRYAPDGKVMAAGKVDFCLDCHRKQKENEYIMTAPVK